MATNTQSLWNSVGNSLQLPPALFAVGLSSTLPGVPALSPATGTAALPAITALPLATAQPSTMPVFPVGGRPRWRGVTPRRKVELEQFSKEEQLFVVLDSRQANRTILDFEEESGGALLDLIFCKLPSADLLSLCLVSKQFRHAAAKQLYRAFQIIFPDEDEYEGDVPYDALAAGLETFATSDYDYAQHLQEFDIGSQCGGEKGERAYAEYHYDVSCGKFMNTLLLLTLKKAKRLQSFKWDIRVELSRSVFQVLHAAENLQHLHLRMQAGPFTGSTGAPSSPGTSIISTTTSPVSTSSYAGTIPPNVVFVTASKGQGKPSKSTKATLPIQQAKLPTLSGFKTLNSLAILDMDEVDYVEEIKECLENTSPSIRTLKLSFSTLMANRAQTPQPEPLPEDDSEQEDEFGQLMPPPPGPPGSMPPPGAADPNGPTKILKAQEEKKRQENFLSKIFGLDKAVSIPKPAESINKKPSGVARTSNEGLEHLKKFQSMQEWITNNMPSDPKMVQMFNFMLEAGTIHVAAVQRKKSKESLPKTADGDSTSAKPSSSQTQPSGESTMDSEPGLFDDTKVTKIELNPDVSNPEAIDVEAPEEQETSDNGSDDGAISDNEAGASVSVGLQTNKAEEEKAVASKSRDSTARPKRLTLETAPQMKDYIRTTRGLTLHTLAICLIPIRASVLFKGIDFSVLKNITLLSVGSQVSFWNTAASRNAISPLPLSKIHTDHVTLPFIAFVNQLHRVEELCLYERSQSSSKKGPEITTGPTNVVMKHIRQLILKKHMDTLRVLLLRNSSSSSWDLDHKSTNLMSARAQKLEELSISFGPKVMQLFLLALPSLTSLRALHIIRFHSHDNVINSELRRFITENISRKPQMRLEFVALDILLERIKKRVPEKEKEKRIDRKGKGKEKAPKKHKNKGKVVMVHNGTWVVGNPKSIYPQTTPHQITPTSPAGLDWGDDSDEEESPREQKVEVEIIHFADVSDVRIFQNEVMLGKL